MCGIAGILHMDGEAASPAILGKMTDVIAHRGPDGEGQWVEENVGIGHRRLAIIDLSEAGHQPMISPDHRYVLSYNGEVYNFQELRTELQAAGYWFQSQTDSEVVLHAFAQWGPECVHRFNGMFAYVIWDRKEKTLHLARDRYGIKPLYYAQWGSTFLFGSEQKAILEHPAARKEIDKKALLEYFTFQNIFTDRTLLENVKLFPAATVGRICPSGKNTSLKLTQYWDYQFVEPESVKDSREYEEELDRLLKQALKRQLVTDVELGSYLSGGMDSGTLTALAAKELPYIKTFTCGFDLSSASGIELGFDERHKAEAMSALYQTEHYEMVLKAGDMERCLPKFTWHLEEPRVGQSYPNYYVAGLASKFVKVVLSGAGGDELFAGYPWRYYRAVLNDDFEHYIDQYYGFWQRLIPNKDIQKVFTPIWDEVKDVWTREIFRDVFPKHNEAPESPTDYINQSLYFESKTFLHGLLVVEDKLSMAHGLETRVPFLDNDLVDFATRCPVSLKLNNLSEVTRINENDPGGKQNRHFQKTSDGKQILRNVMSRYVPDSITSAPKQGFSSPDASWFKGQSMDYVKRRLFAEDNQLYNFMDRHSVETLVSGHLSGEQNRRLLIWSLLNVQHFMEEYCG
jgi:asparagine synthase (glutamine-hydrolysing)